MLNKKIIGIVAEYNPFHNGHLYQIEQVRKLHPTATIVSIMSGNFLQRGTPALLDKWTRAELAVQSGVDLAIELPFAFACRSAEYFAWGAISILNATNSVDFLAFGAETDSLEQLQNIAEHCLQTDNIEHLKKNMKLGYSYPHALQKSLPTAYQQIFTLPNNILAIEYLKQLHSLHSSIQPLLIARQASQYKDTQLQEHTASATAIRAFLTEYGVGERLQKVLPPTVFKGLQQAHAENSLVLQNDKLTLLLLHKLRDTSAEYLQTHTDVSEGLEYKLLKSASTCNSYQELVEQTAGKRYPHSRIARILLQSLVGLPTDRTPNYLRVLAFNKSGQAALKKIKAKSNLSIVTKIGRDFAHVVDSDLNLEMLRTDIKASNIYQLLLPPNKSRNNIDFYQSPIFLK